MKANDLMIGDWVRLTDPINNGEIVQVIAIYADGYVAVEGGLTNRVKPIPLTPEILKKNGFGYVENDVNPYNDEVLSHFYLGEEGYCANMDIHIGTYNKGVFWFNSPRVSLNCIRYVHEFQHALRLCGIDKEIEI